jgi:cytochrome c biogenesis protein ResB
MKNGSPVSRKPMAIQRKKNARFELSAMIRSYLNELRDATDDAEALKTLTQTKNSISESEQLLVAVTIILRSCALTDVIRELRRALAGYRSQRCFLRLSKDAASKKINTLQR